VVGWEVKLLIAWGGRNEVGVTLPPVAESRCSMDLGATIQRPNLRSSFLDTVFVVASSEYDLGLCIFVPYEIVDRHDRVHQVSSELPS